MPILRTLALAALGTFVASSAVAAIAVDGHLDAGYGQALSTQTTQTDATDATSPYTNGSYGSELDEGYGFVAVDTLHLFVTGNLYSIIGPSNPTFHWDDLVLFLDTGAGGQSPLRGDNTGPGQINDLAGLAFDTGFSPGYAFIAYNDLASIYVYEYVLPAGTAGSGDFLGSAAVLTPGAPLSGGTNPYGVEAAEDDENLAGVTGGCGASSGVGVTTGYEFAIPLAAIGSPTGCVRITAFAATRPYPDLTLTLTNQFLGPLPPGTCSLGAASGVDLSSIPGDQSYGVCAGQVSVPSGPRASLSLSLSAPWPNPARGATRVRLTLDRAAPVRVQVVDVSGRKVASVFDGTLGPGPHTLTWSGRRDDGSAAPGGVYFLEAMAAGKGLTRRAVLLAAD